MEDIIKSFILDNIQINTIYLYGSFINGSFRDDSDIDCAIISDNPVDSVRLYNEMIALKEYSMLNDERNIILKEIY
ncbi:MAG: nucleotidyltransferase domain-containing protein [Spirochaetes bacterium]|jgi:predicted nucleotidyltransferase|nr:nucleotidyltransferase domain-containing protein [Spirochaetota bacterium]